jgi:hypothetical protein
MKRRDSFAITETYSFALAPVIGPFFEALGALAHNLGEARSSLKSADYLSAAPDDNDA